jgi:hypothetical protein
MEVAVAVAVALALGVAPVALAEPEAAEVLVAAKPVVVGEPGALASVRPVKKGSTAFCER